MFYGQQKQNIKIRSSRGLKKMIMFSFNSRLRSVQLHNTVGIWISVILCQFSIVAKFQV